MIGSADLDVDGILDGGVRESLMRRDEWVTADMTNLIQPSSFGNPTGETDP